MDYTQTTCCSRLNLSDSVDALQAPQWSGRDRLHTARSRRFNDIRDRQAARSKQERKRKTAAGSRYMVCTKCEKKLAKVREQVWVPAHGFVWVSLCMLTL